VLCDSRRIKGQVESAFDDLRINYLHPGLKQGWRTKSHCV